MAAPLRAVLTGSSLAAERVRLLFIGGLLLAHYWWGAAFLMGVPVMVLLLVVGYTMSKQSGLTGWRLWFSAALAGLLGVAIIVMKSAMK